MVGNCESHNYSVHLISSLYSYKRNDYQQLLSNNERQQYDIQFAIKVHFNLNQFFAT